MNRIAEMLCSHSFKELFQHLGWDRASTDSCISIDGQTLNFRAVAQKRGLVVLHCLTDRVVLADRTLLRKAQKRLLRVFHEHIVIYSSEEPRKQVWQWAIRLPDGRRVGHREHPFFSDVPPLPFVARLEKLRFLLEEEENASIIDAVDRVRTALDTWADCSLFVRRPRLARISDQLARLIQTGDQAAFHKFILLHRPLARKISGVTGRPL